VKEDAARRARVHAILVAEFVDPLNRGADVDIEDVCAGHRGDADELRTLAREFLELRTSPALGGANRGMLSILDALDGARTDDALGDSREGPQEMLRHLAELAGPPDRYRLENLVGQGGMGVIRKAWDQNLRRWVVVKTLTQGPGTDGQQHRGDSLAPEIRERALARFLDEALVTGQLDHPGIVPVYEVGTDEEGRAYFTMKLVEGRDLREILSDLCSPDSEWSKNRVVGVLRRVCEAVAYAHSKGVLHRDIKPANIMVGRFGEAYIMDWGLARVPGVSDELDQAAMARATMRPSHPDLSRAAPDACLYTQDGDVLGTPIYMPPEQAGGDVDKIDERSDVYAVGAILYQVICGKVPYMEDGEDGLQPFEVLMRVRRGPPRRVEELAPDARPGLVEICVRAMQRDPSARFKSMAEMGRALGDFLEDISEDRELARRQTKRATLINEFLMEVLGSGDPAQAQGREVSIREAIERAAERLEQGEGRALAPLDRAALNDTIGNLFTRLGRYDQAESYLVEARRLHEQLLGEDAEETLNLGTDLAVVLRRQGRLDEAEAMLRHSLERQIDHLGLDHKASLRTKFNLGLVVHESGARLAEAEALLSDAFVARQTLLETDALDTLIAMDSLGLVIQHRGRPAEAEELHRRAVSGLIRTQGHTHPSLLIGMQNLAGALRSCGTLGEAVPMQREVLRLKIKVLTREHQETVGAMNNLAMMLRDVGHLEEAEGLLRGALEIQVGCDRGDNLASCSFRANLGLVVSQRGDDEGAEPLFRTALEGAQKILGEESRSTVRHRYQLGCCLLRQGLLDAAEAELNTARDFMARILPQHDRWLVDVSEALAEVNACRGRSAHPVDEAESYGSGSSE
jgi:serine/threonine protein kinase